MGFDNGQTGLSTVMRRAGIVRSWERERFNARIPMSWSGLCPGLLGESARGTISRRREGKQRWTGVGGDGGRNDKKNADDMPKTQAKEWTCESEIGRQRVV